MLDYYNLLEENQFHVDIEIPEEPCHVMADGEAVTRILKNLLDNAVKYSPSGSRIDVRLRTGESFLCVEIEDRGCGIREEEQGRIFERFYRAKEVSTEPGFGIGLYLVREVLSRQGGYARVKSAPGEGTTMYLYLSRYAEGAGSPHF